MTTITLGLARIGDIPAIAQLSRVQIEQGLPWHWTARRVAAHMRQRDSLLVVAKDNRELVGFVMAQFGDAAVHVTLLGVAASWQRRGAGRRLMAWVEESAMAAGLFKISLEVRAGNRAALRFYAALGYTQSGILDGYYSGVEDAITLVRDLRVGAVRPKGAQ
jgi:[ribosomal protein S18]-alanine N-acetyltransferase